MISSASGCDVVTPPLMYAAWMELMVAMSDIIPSFDVFALVWKSAVVPPTAFFSAGSSASFLSSAAASSSSLIPMMSFASSFAVTLEPRM